MITINVYGGLGNQMFQYASGKSVSLKKNTELSLDKSLFKNYKLHNFLLDKFNIKYVDSDNSKLRNVLIKNNYTRYILSQINKFKICRFNILFEREEFLYNKNIDSMKFNYMFGYWQSVDYFKDIRKELLIDFSLKDKLDTNNKRLLADILKSNSVSIHVRRGDYLKTKDARNGHGLCSLEYYNDSIKYINERVPDANFYVFSDDIEWVKNSFVSKSPMIFVNNNFKNPEKDLILIKNCKHNIIANSTFSWWGAWLNENENKIVIMPNKWMNNRQTPIGLIYKNCKII
tara:strand:+ start:724 stop:1587 length:864 start_codon:yes stop_codon:yes gene_type:complete